MRKPPIGGTRFFLVRRSTLTCALFVAFGLWAVLNIGRWRTRELLLWDAEAYHQYLPAVFIHHDLLDMRYLQQGHPYIVHPDFSPSSGIFMIPATRHACNKYSCGTALFEAPAFLVAQAWATRFAPADAMDGEAPPYQLALAIGSVLWTAVGLWILGVFLRRYLSDTYTALALVVIGFGTNLFYYAAFAPGMAHPFLFVLFSAVLERTDSWYRRPTAGKAVVLGLVIGLVALTRPVDVLVALVPLTWGLGTAEARQHTWTLWRTHRAHLWWAAMAAIIGVLPQLLYWKATTGHFLFYSYRSERFILSQPHVLDGLFSYRKGWFVYTPLVLLMWCGVPLLWRDRTLRSYAVMLFLFFLPFVYLVFSWWSWSYGGGFGARPMIESLALLALPFGVLARTVFQRKRSAWRWVLSVALLTGMALYVFQQWQYFRGYIRWDDMTAERYWQVFGRTDISDLPPFP